MKVTEKLFYQDGYMRSAAAHVISCVETKKGYEIVLDKTCFFPEGGGQSADMGTLNGIAVTDVKEKQNVICHHTQSPLKEGEEVQCEIDFEDRFSKMQQHSGEHIVSGLVHERFGYDNVGFHLGRDLVTLDFNGVITKEQLEEIEWKANHAVTENLEIYQTFPAKGELDKLVYRSKIDIEGQVRIITVPGYDVCACCAPHVKRTGEIGMIKFTGIQNYKGGVRISMLCGFRALLDYRRKDQYTKTIMCTLSAKEEKITDAVTRQKSDNEALNLKNLALLRQVLAYKAEDAKVEKVSLFFEQELDGDGAREYMNQILKRNVRLCAVFFGAEKGEYRYVIGSKEMDVREIGKEMNALYAGKGGGKSEMIQGVVKASQEELNVFFTTKARTINESI